MLNNMPISSIMIVPQAVMPILSRRFIRAQMLSYLNAQTSSCVLSCAWVLSIVFICLTSTEQSQHLSNALAIDVR